MGIDMNTVTYPSGVVAPLPPQPVKQWTVDEYHQLLQNGTFESGDPFELLEGWIVPKMSRNAPHDVSLVLVRERLSAAVPAGWHVRVQSAITTADSEPEPDVAVVRGAARDYLVEHPGPPDIGLVVEIADSSLRHDRGAKARIYARANIAVYWIVNLADEQVEIYTDPDPLAAEPSYLRHVDFLPGDSVPLVLDGREVTRLPVNDLLP
jgi:Uma2 family endonuclease